MRTKKLTREQYQEKFINLLEETNYQLQDGEKIIQCKDPYPAYWFVSNKGYLLSVYGKTIKHVKARYRTTGKTSGNWFYTYVNKSGKRKNVTVHTLFAEHFLGYERNKDLEVHHIKKSKSFSSDELEKCNSVENLQVLPKQIHQKATKIGSHTKDQLDEERNKNVINITISLDEIIKVFKENAKDGNTTMYISNNPDNLIDKTVDVKRVLKIKPLEE